MKPHWLSVDNSGFPLRHFQSNLQISTGLETIFIILDFLDVRYAKKFWLKKAQELFNVKEIMWMWTSMDLFSPSMNGEFFVLCDKFIGFFLKLSPCFQGTEIQPHWVPPGNQSQSEKLAESVLEIVGTLPHSLLWQMSHTLPGPNIEEMRQRKHVTLILGLPLWAMQLSSSESSLSISPIQVKLNKSIKNLKNLKLGIQSSLKENTHVAKRKLSDLLQSRFTHNCKTYEWR